jgi:hypothetical protein
MPVGSAAPKQLEGPKSHCTGKSAAEALEEADEVATRLECTVIARVS